MSQVMFILYCKCLTYWDWHWPPVVLTVANRDGSLCLLHNTLCCQEIPLLSAVYALAKLESCSRPDSLVCLMLMLCDLLLHLKLLAVASLRATHATYFAIAITKREGALTALYLYILPGQYHFRSL